MAWEITELSDTITTADAAIARAAKQATRLWRRYWPDDPLLTIPGIGPITAAATRGWWGDGTQLKTAKAAASFVGLNPSNRESGLSASPSRPITKEGPPELRLAYYQAANIARRHDPQLAVFYQRLMVERGHNHIQATCAVARKLACRAWAICQTSQPYQLRDLDGNPIDWDTAVAIAAQHVVPDAVRRRTRSQRHRKNTDSH